MIKDIPLEGVERKGLNLKSIDLSKFMVELSITISLILNSLKMSLKGKKRWSLREGEKRSWLGRNLLRNLLCFRVKIDGEV